MYTCLFLQFYWFLSFYFLFQHCRSYRWFIVSRQHPPFSTLSIFIRSSVFSLNFFFTIFYYTFLFLYVKIPLGIPRFGGIDMSNTKKTLQDLTIRDNFLFAAVMQQGDNCKKFLEMLLKIKINRIDILYEKTIIYNLCNYSEPSEFIRKTVISMLAYRSSFSYKFIWREARTRKSKGFSSMALNSY